MQVDVKHRLSRLRVAIEHGPIARPIVALVFRNLRGGAHHGADQRVVIGIQVVERRDVLLGHHERVQRRLRIDIGEGQQPVVFVDFRGRDFSGNDPAEQTAHTTAIFLSITATRGMRCRSVLMRLSVNDGKSFSSSANASPWVCPISMNSVPPGFNRCAATSTICRMSRNPSSPASNAVSGSYSRTSGASSSYSGSLMYGGFDRMKSNGPVVPER